VTTRIDARDELVSETYGWMAGKKIARVRPLTRPECHEMGWTYDHEAFAVVVEFEDGTAFVPMADPEGNGCGFLAEATVREGR